MEKVTTTFWVAVDADGDAEFSTESSSDASERYNDNIDSGMPIDIYKIELTVNKPGQSRSVVKIDATQPQRNDDAYGIAVRIEDD
jgi:hypothetical protein